MNPIIHPLSQSTGALNVTLPATEITMAESRFADRQRDKVHEIDKGIKNIFKWEWLHNTVNETPLCDFIRKIKAQRKAKCVWCDQEILYGGRGLAALEQHVDSAKHKKITSIWKK